MTLLPRDPDTESLAIVMTLIRIQSKSELNFFFTRQVSPNGFLYSTFLDFRNHSRIYLSNKQLPITFWTYRTDLKGERTLFNSLIPRINSLLLLFLQEREGTRERGRHPYPPRVRERGQEAEISARAAFVDRRPGCDLFLSQPCKTPER